MATDRLINQAQGEDIIDQLHDIAANVGNITYGPQTSADKVVSMTGYQKASTTGAISQGDTLNEAIGKLEKKADNNATAVADAVTGVKDADNTAYTKNAGVISVPSASTSDRGVTKLSNATDSTSEVLAATPKAVKAAYDLANGKYSLPSGGITTSDLASGVTTSLGKADTAVQTINGDDGAISTSGDGTTKTVSHSTGAGYKHVPAGGSTGQFLGYDSAGTAKWVNNPNTDTHVNTELATTSKAYVLGTTTTPTGTAAAVTTVADTGVYLDTTAGKLTASTINASSFTGNGVTTSITAGSSALVTSGGVATKLGDYVPNSDFVVAENNILYNLNMGVKNILPDLSGTYTVATTTYTWNYKGEIHFKSTDSSTHATDIGTFTLKAGTYVLNNRVVYSAGGAVQGDIRFAVNDESVTHDITSIFTLSQDSIVTVKAYTYGIVDTTITPLLCTKSAWDQSHDYQPPALPNSDLTLLEAEDRAALAEVVDSGAKNLLTNKGQMSHGDVTFTWNNDGSVTVSGTKTAGAECYVNVIDNVPYSNMGLKAGDTIVLSNNGTNAYISVIFYALGSGYTSAITALNEAKPAVLPTDKTNILIRLTVKSDVASVSETIKPMVCTKAAFGVSQKFVPYRPNWDLVGSKVIPSTITITPASTSITIIGSSSWKCNGLAWLNVRVSSTQAGQVGINMNLFTLDNTSLPLANSITVPFVVINNDLNICARGWLLSGYANVGITPLVSIPANAELQMYVCYRYA